MNKRWSDFLFTAAVRLVCGLLIGCGAGLLIGWRIILREEATGNIRFIVIWLLVWALGGAVVAIFRIPHWQTPWYRGIRDSDDDHDRRHRT